MREIKFRAWDKATKHMIVTGFHVFGEYTLFNGIGHYLHENHLEKATLDRYDDVEVMEFTGILDKNKKEIYEGDICKLNGGAKDVFFEVAFEYGCFVARVPWKKDYSPELKAYCYFDSEIMIVEVVGNIYEDPELLTHDT